MSGEFEAVGTIADGGMWARAAEPNAGESTADGHGKCLNCRTVLTGPHCHQCGQAAHVHRSISAFWHDILHGVLHFDGKFWNTLPLLAWQPGHLTRRYIHGERAKFISPMALFLFSIFMMFAIFSYVGSPNFTGDSTIRNKEGTRVIGVSDWREEMRKEIAQIEPKIAASTSELDKLSADDPGRAALTEKITDLKREVNGLTYATEGKARYPEALGPGGENMADMFNFNSDVDTGFKAFDAWINKLASKAKKNPELLLYKIQSNGYKFAWLLIPLSIPFVWLATLGKRGHRFYDHAVFTTYSIAFMSLLFIVVTLSVKFSIVPGIVIPAALFYAPFHMYRQLRHAYGTSRIGGMFRLALLLTCTTIVVTLFLTILVNLGLVG
ncbi:DUF3667 domain-containing protein [Blastomonas fulva]|uniref:DUF3667 domain-containing protein n=1 Tax=Blastomonas fulva TaxID=1550728 RepID=UPI0024E1CB5C|nr:DUF3667 domain-containing protein [Blastomonas fulva]MDK2757275.1 DUF3667 domain-containing protein [Blastomonas fulva]MDM7929957.1 DUF3667 domain-containing protein [Blastomonas fulva]MDM7966278.1 DUF3667 domain-containing protein [Blastomonas fulva]